MPYEKQEFKNRIVDEKGNVVQEGTKLRAEHLDHIEQGIVDNEAAIEEVEKKIPTDYMKASDLTSHDESKEAHSDIRLLIEASTKLLNELANSEDVELDQMAEIVEYIKNNRSYINDLTKSKVNVLDIIDNLTSNISNKPLSAAQGVMLKGLIDELSREIANLGVGATQEQIEQIETNKNNIATLQEEKANVTYVDNEIIKAKASQNQIQPLFMNSFEELELNGDTKKVYVLPDGLIYAYMESESPEVTIPNFTNQLPISTDGNGNVYNSKGYKENTRISTSSGYAERELADVYLTGYIKVTPNDVLRFEDITFTSGDYAGHVYLYTSSMAGIQSSAITTAWFNPVKDSNGNVVQITIPVSADYTDIGYVRINAKVIKDTSIITKNETIEYTTVGGTQVGWQSTGHAFVPHDDEERIIALETISEYTIGEIEKLKEEADDNDFIDQYDFKKYGLPILSLTGDTTGMSKDVKKTLSYSYEGKYGTCTLKWQGSSSLSYEKKNYTITFDNPFEAKSGWGSQSKYCLKANFIDHTHARNIVSAKLWGKLVKSRTNVDSRLNALPNGGAIDGFPIVIELNGQFHGLYTFNIPKEDWMFGMDGTGQQAILCAESPSNTTTGASFNALAVLDGSDFDLEYSSNDESEWVVTSINRLIQAVMNSDGTDLDTTIAQYLDWESAIDHYIFTTLLQAEDNVMKNYLLSTYDGVKWFFTEYDMDTTYGLYWTGKRFYANDECHQFRTRTFDKLMNLIWTYKRPQLRARYNELRGDIMAEDKVAREFLNFSVAIPSPILDMDVKAHPTIPSSAVNNVSQILNNYRLRVMLCDEWIKSTSGEQNN